MKIDVKITGIGSSNTVTFTDQTSDFSEEVVAKLFSKVRDQLKNGEDMADCTFVITSKQSRD